MRPSIRMLDEPLMGRVLGEALQLLMQPGVGVGSAEARDLLGSAGAVVEGERVRIPEALALKCLSTAPREFALYNRSGAAVVHYGGDAVHFDPGSSCVNVLDGETRTRRPAETRDLVSLTQLAEVLPQFDAQSTAVVCSDVPEAIADLYRLYVVLSHSNKPVVTGAFSAETLPGMLDLLVLDAGSDAGLRAKPRAVFDVCPSPPLNWTNFAAQNMIQLARAGVPAQIVSMPMAGATAPVTLIGSVTQHAAESLAGIVIHQLAAAGAPVVWGGAPSIFDMRTGITPVGAIESVMLNLACAQVGKHLGLPTHGYLVASDAKLLDAQAGAESGASAVLGALAGINMISGAGMLESLACHSAEKLVLDAELIASARRLVNGFETPTATLATEAFASLGKEGFLASRETRSLFRSEHHLPSPVIDREGYQEGMVNDAFSRAHAAIPQLIASYSRPALRSTVLAEFAAAVERQAHRFGVTFVPGVFDPSDGQQSAFEPVSNL
jgi:trimethylamine--corrinoid protein Co-methyltransferase